jgi:ribulose-phosphate 3-epimerase
MHTGRGGQKFLERCVPKVSELRARFPDKDIEVDGGVGPKTIDVCADAGKVESAALYCTLTTSSSGSNVIVAGTAIFGAPNHEQVIAHLKAAVDAAQAKIAK